MAMTAATEAFEEALTGLGLDAHLDELGDLRALGRRAALLAVAGTVWERHLGPLLTSRQVAELLGGTTRQAVSDRVARGRILALPEGRELTYPAFQFDARGRPYAALPAVLEVLGPHLSPHSIGSWFVTAQADLDGATPVAWLAEGRGDEAVVEAARRTAVRASR